MPDSRTASDARFTAVVYATDGVRFVATAPTPEALTRQLVDYVEERAAHTLWPATAATVRELIERGRSIAAIAAYFDAVGDRWDDEWIEVGADAEVLAQQVTRGANARVAS